MIIDLKDSQQIVRIRGVVKEESFSLYSFIFANLDIRAKGNNFDFHLDINVVLLSMRISREMSDLIGYDSREKAGKYFHDKFVGMEKDNISGERLGKLLRNVEACII